MWPPLRMSRRRVAAGLALDVIGEVDLATADDLLIAVRETIRLAAVWGVNVLVDLRGVDFLSAAGLRVLVTAHTDCATAGPALVVIADHDAVLRPLRITGLDRLLTIVTASPLAADPRNRCGSG